MMNGGNDESETTPEEEEEERKFEEYWEYFRRLLDAAENEADPEKQEALLRQIIEEVNREPYREMKRVIYALLQEEREYSSIAFFGFSEEDIDRIMRNLPQTERDA